jgi:hypothetical protein
MIKKKHSFTKSKNILLLGTLIFLFILPNLFQAEAIWNNPQEITINANAGYDTHVVVDIDDNGVVHFANTLYFEGYEEDTNIYYSNNSAPEMFDSFLSGTSTEGGNQIQLTNRDDDSYELIDGVSTSISVGGPNNVPLVGFHSKRNNTVDTEAFLSAIAPSNGNSEIIQLSTYESHYDNNSNDADYAQFEYIDRLGSNFILSRSSGSPMYATFESVNPSESFEISEMEFIDEPTIVSVSDKNKYIAAGNTLIVYNQTGDLVGYEGYSYPISTIVINSTHEWIFLTSGRTLYWYNISKDIPKLINSIELDIEETSRVYDVDIVENYLYYAAGEEGIVSAKYNNNTLSLENAASRFLLNADFRGICVANDSLYYADEIGIYSSTLLSYESIGIIGQLYRTDPYAETLALDAYTYDNSTYLYSALSNNTILVYNITDDSVLGFIDSTGSQAITDIELDPNSDYGYAAAGTDGIEIFNYKTHSHSTLWDGSGNFVNVHVNGTQLFTCNILDGSAENIVEVDISNPTSPSKVGANSTVYGGGPIYIDSESKRAYLNDQNYGLIILDISDIDNPVVIGIKSLNGDYDSKIYEHNDYIYILDKSNNNGLVIVNATNFEDLKTLENKVSSIHFGGTNILNDIFVWNNGTETWGYISNSNSSHDLISFNLSMNAMQPQNISISLRLLDLMIWILIQIIIFFLLRMVHLELKVMIFKTQGYYLQAILMQQLLMLFL